MVSLHVKGWDDTKVWTCFTGYHPKELERRLVTLTGQRRDLVKDWVRQLKRRECVTLPLVRAEDELEASSLRSFVESVGAVVEDTDA
jgi:hypothetical protein